MSITLSYTDSLPPLLLFLVCWWKRDREIRILNSEWAQIQWVAGSPLYKRCMMSWWLKCTLKSDFIIARQYQKKCLLWTVNMKIEYECGHASQCKNMNVGTLCLSTTLKIRSWFTFFLDDLGVVYLKWIQNLLCCTRMWKACDKGLSYEKLERTHMPESPGLPWGQFWADKGALCHSLNPYGPHFLCPVPYHNHLPMGFLCFFIFTAYTKS